MFSPASCFSQHISISSSSGYSRFWCWCLDKTEVPLPPSKSSFLQRSPTVILHVFILILELTDPRSVKNKNVQTSDDNIYRTGLNIGINKPNMLCVKYWDQRGTIKLRKPSFYKLKWARRNLRTLLLYHNQSKVGTWRLCWCITWLLSKSKSV